MKLFLGVDGGQSGTTALIGDSFGNVLGRGTAGPSNHVSSSEAEAKLTRVVQACVGAALKSAGVNEDASFASVCFGMSGGPADKESTLRRVIQSDRWRITDDATIALSGALGGAPGVVCIAGTGSIALGRNAGGATRRAGGWGHIFGDEGGAFDLVRQALRVCLQAEEGWGPPTQLSRWLLDKTGCATINEVLHLFYTDGWPRGRVAALAQELDAIADEDGVVEKLCSQAGEALAGFVIAVRNQLWPSGDSVPCSYVGGVFRNARIRERYAWQLERNQFTVSGPLFGPAMGALITSYQIAEVHPLREKLLSSTFCHE